MFIIESVNPFNDAPIHKEVTESIEIEPSEYEELACLWLGQCVEANREAPGYVPYTAKGIDLIYLSRHIEINTVPNEEK